MINTFIQNNNLLLTKLKSLSWKEIIKSIYEDLFTGFTLLQTIYIITLGLMPLGIELYTNGQIVDWTGLIASTSGILCVIYVAFGRASNYFWGTINCIIYLILSINATFYGEVITTLYFFIMQPIGLWLWLVNSIKKQQKPLEKENDYKIKVNHLTLFGWAKWIAYTAFIWLIMGFAYKSIGAARPFRDSITDGANYTGQMLMNGVYWEQWIFWIATNLFSLYLWWGTNIQIQGMYWVYTLNSIVGMLMWFKQNKKV